VEKHRFHDITPTGVLIPKFLRWENGTGAFISSKEFVIFIKTGSNSVL